MGLSKVGTFFAISIVAPNLLMVIFPPRHVPDRWKSAGLAFTVMERVGQVACLLFLVFLGVESDARAMNIWFVVSIFCVACYYGLWIRYFVKGRDFMTLFSPMILPIPMAWLPMIAFGLMAIGGRSVWLGLADGIFAVGHIANSWHTYNCTKRRR